MVYAGGFYFFCLILVQTMDEIDLKQIADVSSTNKQHVLSCHLRLLLYAGVSRKQCVCFISVAAPSILIINNLF